MIGEKYYRGKDGFENRGLFVKRLFQIIVLDNQQKSEQI
jgi:hypothetical protein